MYQHFILIFFLTISISLPEKTESIPCRRNFTPLFNSCYHFSTNDVTWIEAVMACTSMNASLVSFETAEEALAINTHILYHFNPAGTGFWTSGTDLGTEGKFRWASSLKNFGYANWCSSEPNNDRGHENCVQLRYEKNNICWNDLPCNIKMDGSNIPMYYICEYW